MNVRGYKHFLLLPVLGTLILWFSYCEKAIVPKYYMFSQLDLYIPFIKEFVVIYLLWYAYLAVGFLYLGIASKKDYYRLFVFLSLGIAISNIIYMMFPNGQNLRPDITGTDFFSRIMNYVYTVDTPTNVAPSMHVIGSIAVHTAMQGCEKLRGKIGIKAASFIFMSTVIASTVLVKQHSIVDVVAGCAVSAFLYAVVYFLPQHIGRHLARYEREQERDAS